VDVAHPQRMADVPQTSATRAIQKQSATIPMTAQHFHQSQVINNPKRFHLKTNRPGSADFSLYFMPISSR
jgi:hypothetical protein